MLFNSYIFILLFLPLSLFCFYIFNKKKNLIIFISSLIFYSYWDYRFLPLLLLSISFNYFISNYINKKNILLFGILVNLFILFIFKYLNFFLEEIEIISSSNFNFIYFILPLGISFFTFQQISFLVDLKRKKFNFEDINFTKYAAYITFFPQLIAGPIVRYLEVSSDFSKKNKRKVLHNLIIGILIFTIGLFKKVIIADSFSEYSNILFDNLAPSSNKLQLIETWFCVFAYSFQLYFDFSAYSDMALGIARMFGIKIPFNFIAPYRSLTITQFWKRWHITLSNWLRDYLFIPLGGSKHGNYLTIRNLFIVMVIGGIWHGAGWTFLIWGVVHALYLVEEKFITNKIFLPYSNFFIIKIFLWSVFFIKLSIAWVLFRSPDIVTSFKIILALFNFSEIILPLKVINYLELFTNFNFEKGITFRYFNGVSALKNLLLGLIICLFGFCVYDLNPSLGSHEKKFYRINKPLYKVIINNNLTIFLFTLVLTACFFYSLIYISRPSTFLYFQF